MKILFSAIFLLLVNISVFAQKEIKPRFYHFKGIVAQKDSVSMDLIIGKRYVKGVSYFINSPGFFIVKGIVESDGKIQLIELQNEIETGAFVGQIKGNVFSGTWQNVIDKRKTSFNLKNDFSKSVHGIKFFKYKNFFSVSDDKNSENNYLLKFSFIYPVVPINNNSQLSIIKILNKKYFGKQCFYPAMGLSNYVQTITNDIKNSNYVSKSASASKSFVSTQLLYNDNNFFTIKKTKQKYNGDFRESDLVSYYNFDIKTGELYRLNDILDKSKDRELIEKIKRNYVAVDTDDIAMNNIKIPDNFAIVNGGILLRFSDFDSGDFLNTGTTILLKFADIKDCLTAKFRKRIGI